MEAKLRVVDGAKSALIRLKLPTVIGRSPEANGQNQELAD